MRHPVPTSTGRQRAGDSYAAASCECPWGDDHHSLSVGSTARLSLNSSMTKETEDMTTARRKADSSGTFGTAPSREDAAPFAGGGLLDKRLKLLWLTLTQVHSACEIEFLPVYYPSEEERSDPKLYARNVRDVMAK
ncbi:Lysophosphatidylcholine acyltransferase [Eumeta japonica]|uniref:Lysophosphatidylcholine acyltransferase n=1 Tax=Eumeta variegata TaxID=151549 RepID=A0A4C1T3F3_EUMVA|nr:Lysophosphatidylcholine acyltransferase [Eumeta japonica]